MLYAFISSDLSSKPVYMNASVGALPANQPTHMPGLIAPLWHTGLFLFALAGLSFWSVRYHSLLQIGPSPRIASYLFILASEWILLGIVALGIRSRGITLAALIGERWSTASKFFRDLGIALGFLVFSNLFLAVIAGLLHSTQNQNVRNLLPHTAAEKAVWVFIALTAGICEEITIRGYLQRQFTGLFRNSAAGIVTQGVLFGLAHAYQGWKQVVVIAILGCLLGWLAHWRKSLRPGILAHFLQDLGGLLGGGR